MMVTPLLPNILYYWQRVFVNGSITIFLRLILRVWYRLISVFIQRLLIDVQLWWEENASPRANKYDDFGTPYLWRLGHGPLCHHPSPSNCPGLQTFVINTRGTQHTLIKYIDNIKGCVLVCMVSSYIDYKCVVHFSLCGNKFLQICCKFWKVCIYLFVSISSPLRIFLMSAICRLPSWNWHFRDQHFLPGFCRNVVLNK